VGKLPPRCLFHLLLKWNISLLLYQPLSKEKVLLEFLPFHIIGKNVGYIKSSIKINIKLYDDIKYEIFFLIEDDILMSFIIISEKVMNIILLHQL
jgi:hypothetical protein